MFGGIVERVGVVKKVEEQAGCKHFSISAGEKFLDLNIGDSIAINGVCLTVTQQEQQIFHVTAVPETLRLTNLGQLVANDHVNLERSLPAQGRIGGHYVQGHVDTVAQIRELQEEGSAWLVKFNLSSSLTKYLVRKGYVAIDGMSITVIDVGPDWFTATFIPHTIENTIVRRYQPGSQVNIEVDMLAKYIEKLFGERT